MVKRDKVREREANKEANFSALGVYLDSTLGVYLDSTLAYNETTASLPTGSFS